MVFIVSHKPYRNHKIKNKANRKLIKLREIIEKLQFLQNFWPKTPFLSQIWVSQEKSLRRPKVDIP